jgi:2-polyprenyl-3-methyl-5-hydroxy-6-metoxy-1,4-benzoquinol methylase
MLAWLLRRRAKGKFDKISPWIEGDQILDLGCGEGYLGDEIHRRLGRSVVLADVVLPSGCAQLPFVLCQQGALPFKPRSFDTVLLIFVLHHDNSPVELLQAASRVACRRLIVWESLRRGRWQAMLLGYVDGAVNFLRSRGKMGRAVYFFTAGDLREAIRKTGWSIHSESQFGNWLHPQGVFVMGRTNDELRMRSDGLSAFSHRQAAS